MRVLIATLIAVLFSVSLWAKENIVVLQTSNGDIVLEMYPDIAPLAVENFVTHVKNGYYDGLIFHRVIDKFMIQGGDPTGTGRGGESIWGKKFKDEYAPNITFARGGLLAMANAGRDTNGSQFFITFKKTPWCNGKNVAFGRLIKGFNFLLDELQSVETATEFHIPKLPIRILDCGEYKDEIKEPELPPKKKKKPT